MRIALTLTDYPFLLGEGTFTCSTAVQPCRALASFTLIARIFVTVDLVRLIFAGWVFNATHNPSMSGGPHFLLVSGFFRRGIKRTPRRGVQCTQAGGEFNYDKAHYALAETYSCLTVIIYV
jgi:hypothetical protein